jgi:histidinol-phosphate aminotransferase
LKPLFQKNLYQIEPYVPGEQPAPGTKIIKLNTNENPYPPSPMIQKVAKEVFQKGILRKYPEPTSRTLTEEIAKQLKLSPDMILVTNGSDEGLALLFRAVLGENSKLTIPYPTYSLYPVLVDQLMNGTTLEKVPLLPDLHFDLPKLSKSKGNLLAFANPNAPTGILESKSNLLGLIKKFSGIVLCDEAYIDFAPKGSSLVSLVKECKNLVVSRTFSKSYSLAGLRVGYLVSSPENIALIYKMKDSYNLGMLEQRIALAAIKDTVYFQNIIQKIVTSRKSLKTALENLGFFVVPSDTNFLFTKPPKHIAPEKLFLGLKEKGIYIRYFRDNLSKEYVRITIGTEQENKQLLKSIQIILKENHG